MPQALSNFEVQPVTCSCIFAKPFKGLSFHPNENETDFTVSGFCAPRNWCLPASHISILQDFIQKKESEIAFGLLRNLEGNLRLIFSKSFDLKYSNTDCFIKVLSKDIFFKQVILSHHSTFTTYCMRLS